MKACLAAILTIVSAAAGGQPVLDFRNDLAFQATTVNAFAAQVYRQRLDKLKAEHDLDVNQALLNRVRGIVERLLPAAVYERPTAAKIAWEVHVCRKCDENASAMAGGKLLVGEKFIVSINPTDDELAYLLAHEMGHVLAEHTREFATSARYFVGMGLKRDYQDIQHEIDESFSLQLRMAPLYKEQELEADYIGFVLGARSGFEPRAMLSLLRKMHSDGPSMLDAHPSTKQRLQQIEAAMPAAQRLYARGISGR